MPETPNRTLAFEIDFDFEGDQAYLSREDDVEELYAHLRAVVAGSFAAMGTLPVAGDIIRHVESAWEHIHITQREFIYNSEGRITLVYTIRQPE
ncbi:hypothetical protein [Hymenobacter coalescens]